METLALTINLVLFGLHTLLLIYLAIDDAKQEKKAREKLKKAA
jgi:hypothetical protein